MNEGVFGGVLSFYDVSSCNSQAEIVFIYLDINVNSNVLTS